MYDELNHPIILFDGVCNLCCSSVQFIIKHDKKKFFRFASLQSHFAEQLFERIELQPDKFASIVLLQNKKTYFQSSAVLLISKKLSGLLPLFYVFIILPKFIRNGIYNFIARHRYQWFGKRNECWLPTKELSELFYD